MAAGVDEWTTDKPTETGLYWAYDGEYVVAVDAYQSIGGIVLFELGDSYDHAQEVDGYTHFMGPLREPEPPEDSRE